MVDSSDFEAFYAREKEKASRVIPPSSSYGLTTAPSRHLFFAHEEEDDDDEMRAYRNELQSDKESTFKSGSGYAGASELIGLPKNYEIETFRKINLEFEGTAQNALAGARGLSSAHGNGEQTGTKTTNFESPYWPG